MSKFKSLLCFVTLCSLLACNRKQDNTTTANPPTITNEPTDTGGSQDDPDLVAITDVVHNFYKWYDKSNKGNQDYVNSKGKVSKLDNAKLDAYYAELLKSGFLSKTYIDNDRAYLKKYEAEWQKNNENGNEAPLSGVDFDRIFCGQDWDINFFTTSAVSAEQLGIDKATATLSGTEGGLPKEQKVELVKENGKWLISKILCPETVEETPVAVNVPSTPYSITVNLKKGTGIKLAGKDVELDNLQKELTAILLKQATLPKSIPVKYEGEVLMGMRGEVETEVSAALAAAQKAKSKSPSANKKTTVNKASTALTVVVNEKGSIKVGGKMVTFDNLKKELQNELVKKSVVPDKIPIKFEGTVMMGMRQEVETLVNEAIAGAKWIRKKAALEAIKIEPFTKFPPEIDGCSCYFSNNNGELKTKQYIYADNYEKIAFVRINGAMQKLTLVKESKSNKNPANQIIKTFKNAHFEATLNIEKTGGVDEVWFYKGKMTVKNKNGQVVIKEIVGECGC